MHLVGAIYSPTRSERLLSLCRSSITHRAAVTPHTWAVGSTIFQRRADRAANSVYSERCRTPHCPPSGRPLAVSQSVALRTAKPTRRNLSVDCTPSLPLVWSNRELYDCCTRSS